MMNYFSLIWKPILEIAILWVFFYMLLAFIKGTRTVQVLKGLVLLAVVFLITQLFQLDAINWILTKLFAISIIGFLIIFQPELRRGLARIGQFGVFVKQEEIIDEIVDATISMSTKKIGAIIAVEREIGLKIFVESGVALDCKITSEMINSIFMPNTPLHDGGIIIEGDRIAAAGCLFPLTQDPKFESSFGTRHRAAVGLTEETDAIAIIVSEESGNISLAVGGRLTRNMDRETLVKVLRGLYKSGRRKKKGILTALNKLGERFAKKS
ncbi:MAG: TIGR00159 family protein [Candidatus Omnitrophica bacterium]|nr:TIGR00159 family protein [Candidatus Omnitrophota bacterium]